MARNRSRTSVSRGTGRNARKWVWARHTATASPATGQAVFSQMLSEFEATYGADLLGITIMRVRGEIKTDQSVVAGLRIFTVPLSGVTNYTAAENGLTANAHADWFMYEPIFLDVTTGVRVKQIDNRASRKMDELNQGVLLVINNLSGSTANLSWDLSFGIKLP